MGLIVNASRIPLAPPVLGDRPAVIESLEIGPYVLGHWSWDDHGSGSLSLGGPLWLDDH